jgi:hypothetical protein
LTATRRSSASEEDYERESLTLGSRDNTVRLWGSFVSSFFLSGSLQSGMIENVLAKDINGLEPRLTRQGYNAKVLVELTAMSARC